MKFFFVDETLLRHLMLIPKPSGDTRLNHVCGCVPALGGPFFIKAALIDNDQHIQLNFGFKLFVNPAEKDEGWQPMTLMKMWFLDHT